MVASGWVDEMRNDAFLQGFSLALGILAHLGYPDHAVQVMMEAGYKPSDLRTAGAEAYDMKPLEEEIARGGTMYERAR